MIRICPFTTLLAMALAMAILLPLASAEIPGGLADRVADMAKNVIIEIINFLTTIVKVISIGMILVGIVLVGLRQEFYGIRLIVGGGIALLLIHLVIPLLLEFL